MDVRVYADYLKRHASETGPHVPHVEDFHDLRMQPMPMCLLRMTPRRSDHVSLRHAVDAVVDADEAVRIMGRELIRIAVAFEPLPAVLPVVLVVEADYRERAAARRHYVMLLCLARGSTQRLRALANIR
jgi:hypothetical protein